MRNADRRPGAGEDDMSADRLLPLDAAAAEALLDGRGDGPPELVALLARATAPGHPVELVGEEFAVAHLRATRPALTSPHPPATRRRPLARVFTVKAAAAAAVAVLALGGVAIAATVGAFPQGIGGSDRGAVGPAASGGGGSVAPGATGASGQSAGPKKTAGPSASASARPADLKALRGLCEAYTRAVAKDPDKALENKAFDRLITAAGGEDKVPQFCADLLGAPAATPSPDAQKNGHPTPTPHAGGPGAPGDE
jgi:hypothetical protein